MSNGLIKCRIESHRESKMLINSQLDVDIDRKNAEEIVQTFKGDRDILAFIRGNILEVYARYPKVTVDCRRPGMIPYPSLYKLCSE